MKILVVDDDAFQRKVIEQTLSIGGYDLIMRNSADDAKKVLEDENVRFVITDWMMPGLDGPSFVRWIRSANITGYVYVMLLTSRESPDDIENGLNAGADDYIKKPSNPRELLARVAVGERILHLEENLRAVSERLEQQALIDELTSLMNRRAIYQIGRQEIIRASRGKTPLSVLFLDLDKFKQINDTHGHLAGDDALKLAARLLMGNIREYDQAGRWAGDEFIALLPNTNVAQSLEVGVRVLRAFRRSALTLEKGAKVVLNASIGLYTWTPGDMETINIDALVRQADLAMYQAKQAGGDQAVTHTEDQQK
jgi:two-component system chemotaxis response regulator CheY